MSTDSDIRHPVEELAEDFVARFRRGERPTIEEYCARCPTQAEEIRELFPALVLMENHGSGASRSATRSWTKVPEQVGDYRIVREIARGGMGIVYEAEQRSLGRRVALKVLAQMSGSPARHLQRFEREARAAARLQHPHIVPVYDVGVQDGIHYYAMQYVDGYGLDIVVRMISHGPHEGESDGWEMPAVFRQLDTRGSSETWTHVARVGLQAAEALAHAHELGIVHRDIKPSNLLLDKQGKIWITDFGLAKTKDAAEMTQAGDLVGTLRYMAPEQFQGWADPRTDIHGLGLTLYELLTLQPAYSGDSRGRIVEQITHESAPRPSSLNRQIPRDLETIVLKAIEKEPGHRYPSAGHMAEDLRKFLADLPIVARRANPFEHTWRWCRRNRMMAGLVFAVLGLLVLVAVGATATSFRLGWLLERAESAEGLAKLRLNEMQRAQRDQSLQLRDSLLNQAHARRLGGEMGQRVESLDALCQAATLTRELALGPAALKELRNEAITCMTLVDLEEESRHAIVTNDIRNGVAFDATLERYAQVSKDRTAIEIRRLADGVVLEQLSGLGETSRIPQTRFSPDGKWLAAKLCLQRATRVTVWRLDEPQPVFSVKSGGEWYYPDFDFSADSLRLAVSLPTNAIEIWDLASRQSVKQLPLDELPSCVRFHPSAPRLAISAGPYLRIVNAESGVVEQNVSRNENRGQIAWSPDGRWLAGGEGRVLNVYDAAQGTLRSQLSGTQASIVHVDFHPNGKLIACTGWDGTTRLWDLERGSELLRANGYCGTFSRDGERLSIGSLGSAIGVWRFHDGGECQQAGGLGMRFDSVSFSEDGRFVAAASGTAFELRDGNNAKLLASIPVPEGGGMTVNVAFDRRGSDLFWTGSQGGLYRLPITIAADEKLIRIGDPKQIVKSEGDLCGGIAVAGDGIKAAVILDRSGGNAVVVDLQAKKIQSELNPQASMWSIDISPQGELVATGTFHGRNVQVWDGETGRVVKSIPSLSAGVTFDPSGNRLAVQIASGFRFFDTSSWTLLHEIHRDYTGDLPGPIGFSSDESLVAAGDSPNRIKLYDSQTYEELATLAVLVPSLVHELEFSRNARKLAIVTESGIQLWDVARIEAQLGQLGLAWRSVPAYPPRTPDEPWRVELAARSKSKVLTKSEAAPGP